MKWQAAPEVDDDLIEGRDFIHKHPSLKMQALSFLLLIGCALVAEGFHRQFPKATSTLRWHSRLAWKV